MHSHLDKAIEALAVDQRFEIAPNQNIGRRLSGLAVARHANRMIGPGNQTVTHIRLKNKRLCPPVALGIHIHRHKGRVIHGDAPFLNRCDKEEFVAFPLEDARKHLDQTRTLDNGALVIPCAIPRDPQIHVTAQVRIPILHGRNTLAPCCARGFGQTFG